MTWNFHPCSRFVEYASAWDELQTASTNTPFLESAFLGPLLDVFGSGDEVLALHDSGGRLDVATILRPRGALRWETFQPSQLPLGPWLCALDADLSAHMHRLMRALPGLVLGLGVTQLDPRLVTRPLSRGSARSIDYIRTPYLEVVGSFDDYWIQRGKNLRQNVRKQRNNLKAEGIEGKLECVTEPSKVAAAIADYGNLESSGWKADTGTNIHASNAQGCFYRTMLENFCSLGRGRIYRYRFGESVVAMDLCIDNGPLVVVLKTTFDESQRQVSPSTLMRQDQFEAWWKEGRFRRIEFYGKTLEWHTRWTATERTLYHVSAYRWQWLERVSARVFALRQSAARSSLEPMPVAPFSEAASVSRSSEEPG